MTVSMEMFNMSATFHIFLLLSLLHFRGPQNSLQHVKYFLCKLAFFDFWISSVLSFFFVFLIVTISYSTSEVSYSILCSCMLSFHSMYYFIDFKSSHLVLYSWKFHGAFWMLECSGLCFVDTYWLWLFLLRTLFCSSLILFLFSLCLLSFLLTLPDSWDVSFVSLWAQLCISRDYFLCFIHHQVVRWQEFLIHSLLWIEKSCRSASLMRGLAFVFAGSCGVLPSYRTCVAPLGSPCLMPGLRCCSFTGSGSSLWKLVLLSRIAPMVT